MNIQPIVEGFGEVDAVPILLRRLRDEAAAYEIDVNPPIRRKRFEFVQEDQVRKAVRLALLQPNCAAILLLFDSDDDCPKTLAPVIHEWAQSESGTVPCAVVMAHREYEAWFLAAIESLRGKRGIRADAAAHPSPETPRGAKKHLEQCMVTGRGYSETNDQAPLSATFDLGSAYARCRSFRRMVAAFGALATSAGAALEVWPPVPWVAAAQQLAEPAEE